MKNHMVKKIMAVSLIGTILLSTGCGKSTEGNTENPGGEKEEVVVNYSMTSDPDILDPSRSDDAQKGAIILEVQETLVRVDQSGVAVPAGAESWTTSEDGLVWTFSLRDNKYADGAEVKAQDYVNALMRTLDPEVGSHNAGTFYVIEGGQEYNAGDVEKDAVGVKALDDKTLEITLKEAVPYFISMINHASVTPIPEALTQGENNTTYGSDAEKMAFSGPFTIESWNRGTSVKLVKNPNYWDAETVEIDRINMLLAEEVNTRQQMFEQGQLDVLESVTAEYMKISEKAIEEGTIVAESFSKPGNSYIAFNNQDPNGIFTNAKIRQAFSISIDRELFVDNVLRKDEVAYGFVPIAINNGETPFKDGTKEPLQNIMDQDPKALFEEGLKELGREGEEITVTFLQGNANNDTKVKSEYFQNQWEKILGVNVEIDTAADSATFNQQVGGGLYQMANTGWGADYNDPMTFLGLFVTGDGNNAALASNEKYDQLINESKYEVDTKIRQEKLTQAEKIAIEEEAFVAPLTYAVQQNLHSSKLTGLIFNGSGGPAVEFKYAKVK